MDNNWQPQMYDRMFAEKTLDSVQMRNKALQEVDFLISVLGLNVGANILDVPCGTGRHSRILAEKHFNVTGIDISKACVDIANHETREGFSALIGDMKDLSSFHKKFDCTLNLFSSFGYFSTDDENERVLFELMKTLKPGGKLVLNLINRNWLLSVFQPVFWSSNSDTLLINASKYDSESKYNETYITVKDEITGEATVSYHRMRLYSPDEIVEMMNKVGLKNIQMFGDLSGAPLDKFKSTHPFYIGQVD